MHKMHIIHLNWHRNESNVLNILPACQLLDDNEIFYVRASEVAIQSERAMRLPNKQATNERHKIINPRTQIYQFDNKILSSQQLAKPSYQQYDSNGLARVCECNPNLSQFNERRNKWYTQNYIRYLIKCISFVCVCVCSQFACLALDVSLRIQMDFAIPKLVRRLLPPAPFHWLQHMLSMPTLTPQTHFANANVYIFCESKEGASGWDGIKTAQQTFAFTKISIQINHTF